MKQIGYNLEAFRRFVGNIPCASVEAHHVEAWLHSGDRSDRTKKSYFIDLQTFFNFAKLKDWCLKSPMDKVLRVTVDDKRPAIFTAEEAARVMGEAQKHMPQMLAYLTLGLFLGIRPEEIERMEWSDVNLESGLVEIRSEVSKTRKRRLVAISENARVWLKLGGQIPPVNLRKNRAKLCALAGVKWSHDILRHSFASYHLAQHKSAEKTSHELGHYDTKMLFEHYRELVTPDEARKFWEILPDDHSREQAKKVAF